jgi:hypothetical protein
MELIISKSNGSTFKEISKTNFGEFRHSGFRKFADVLYWKKA